MDYLARATSLPFDTFIILGVVLALFFTFLKLEKGKAVAAILSLYIGSFLYNFVPFIDNIKASRTLFWNNFAIFSVVFGLLFIVLSRTLVTDFGYGSKRYIRAGALAVAFTGLLISILYHIVPISGVYNFSPFIDGFFETDAAFNLWLLIPLAALFL